MEDQKELLNQLRAKILEEESLRCPADERFLLQFLRLKKWDVDRALKLLLNFFKNKKILFGDSEMVPSRYKGIYDQNVGVLLRSLDGLGRRICLIRIGNWDTSAFGFEDVFMAAFIYFLESAASVETQENGLVFLIDLQGFTFDHARSVGLVNSKNISNFLQGSIPARIKEVHILNNPFIFNFVFSIVKSFIEEKMRKRFWFHGHNLSSLHKVLSPSILPTSIGGDLTCQEATDSSILENLLLKDEHYAEFSRYGYV